MGPLVTGGRSALDRAEPPLGTLDPRATEPIWLTIRSGEASGRSVTVDEASVVLGRGQECDLVVPDPKASRRHVSITPLPDGRASLVDLGAANGTFVNGRRVRSAELEGNEQIQLGDTIVVSSHGESPSAGGTVIGDSPPAQSQSMIHRLVLQRSVRRATVTSGLAVAVAVVLGVLLATGLLSSSGGKSATAVEDVVREAEPSTVVVDASHSDGEGDSGTGWVLDARSGLIVTNAHVVDGRVNLEVGIGGELRKASLVGISPCEDLAVLRVQDPSGLEATPLGSQSAVRRGQTAVALGYPIDASLESNLTVTTGVVSVVRSAYRERTLDLPPFPNVVQTDAAINPGNSGGPLLDLDGKLIGVTSAGRTLTPDGRIIQGQSYAIGVDRVKDVTRVLRRGDSIGSIGVSFGYLTPAELSRRDLPPGLLIEEAARGSAAERAGLGGGDSLLVAVNGRPIDNTLASYCDAVQGLRPGTETTLSVLRPGASRPVRHRLPLG